MLMKYSSSGDFAMGRGWREYLVMRYVSRGDMVARHNFCGGSIC
jgi:hypothetical protein